jgi:LacI family transcriptional regulator
MQTGRRITIEDVARHAGVGKVTVSYVLNGHSKHYRISEETTNRVLRVAQELQYRPNAIARSLATRRTDTLAVVFQYGSYFSTWSSFTGEVMRGIAEATVEDGCDLLLHTKHVNNSTDEAHALADGRVDGALVLRDECDPTLRELVERDFPVVQFFTHNEGLDVPWVDCDNYEGGLLATQHLIGLGHRKIAMVAGAKGSVSSNQRIAAYQASLRENGLSPFEEFGFDAVLDMFRSSDRPTALFSWSDDDAITAMMHFRSMGLKVPEDVSVVGFDSSFAAATSVPPLTSVCQPIRQMAATATKMLVSIVRKREIPERQVLFQPSLDIRGSTAPPPR